MIFKNIFYSLTHILKYKRFICYQGAALFAKRRKRSENWIVDESNVKSTSPSLSEPAVMKQNGNNLTNNQQGTIRAENIQKMNEIQVRN